MPRKQLITSKANHEIIQLPKKGMDKKDFIDSFKEYYVHLLGRDENSRLTSYASEALSFAIRDRPVQPH